MSGSMLFMACGSCLYVSLSDLDEPDSVHDGPDPTNEDTRENGLGVSVAEGVASELLSAAAPGGPPGTSSRGEDVEHEEHVGPADGEFDDRGFAGARSELFSDRRHSCLFFQIL